MSEIHPVASQGFSQGAESYAQARPDYPEACLQWLRHDMGLGPGTSVLEVGAGTGKFTAMLVKTGARVLAVEPVEAMRRRLLESVPGVEAVEGRAEQLRVDDDAFDAVVCAQSFHWFATPEVLAEFCRVLKPGGRLGLVWNLRDRSVPWVDELCRLSDSHEAALPRYSPDAMTALFPSAGFGPLHHATSPHQHTGPPETVIVERTRSVSFVSAMPASEQAEFLAQVRQLVTTHPALAGQATVSFPYVTHMHHAVKGPL